MKTTAPNPSTPEATRTAEVETWELGYGRGITGPTACQWHYMPGWSNDFQIVTLPNSASGNCNTVVAVIPKAQAKWMEYSRLIAAAPDMLAALKKLTGLIRDCHNVFQNHSASWLMKQPSFTYAEEVIRKVEAQ